MNFDQYILTYTALWFVEACGRPRENTPSAQGLQRKRWHNSVKFNLPFTHHGLLSQWLQSPDVTWKYIWRIHTLWKWKYFTLCARQYHSQMRCIEIKAYQEGKLQCQQHAAALHIWIISLWCDTKAAFRNVDVKYILIHEYKSQHEMICTHFTFLFWKSIKVIGGEERALMNHVQ